MRSGNMGIFISGMLKGVFDGIATVEKDFCGGDEQPGSRIADSTKSSKTGLIENGRVQAGIFLDRILFFL
jgi:hypothetical protein